MLNVRCSTFIFLRRLDHAARFDAVGADHHLLGATVNGGADILQVGIKAALVEVVSMAHMVADHGFFSTNFTNFCHCLTPAQYIGTGVDAPMVFLRLHAQMAQAHK